MTKSKELLSSATRIPKSFGIAMLEFYIQSRSYSMDSEPKSGVRLTS